MADEIAKLDVVVELDERPLRTGQKKIEQAFRSIGRVGEHVGNQFQSAFTSGANNAGRAISNMSRKAQRDLNSVSKTMANVKNIAQGIVFAQTFYSALNALKGAVNESWELSKNVEASQKSFAILLQDAERASQTVDFLQEFAARTTFSFDTAATSAKTLLAYGFEFENLAYLMETIGDATAAMGDPEAFNRIARALGQMLAKGTVKAEELRQLTEAGIPAAQILAETLGLSSKEIANIGDLSLSSQVAVNALLNGMEKRFGGLNKTMAMTVTGLQNNIRETLAMIGKGLAEPLYNAFRETLISISSTLDTWLSALKSKGRGGLLDTIFGPDDAAIIRTMVANLMILKNAIGQLFRALAPLGSGLLRIGVSIGNIVLPSISALTLMITGLIEWLTQWRVVTYAVASALLSLLVVKTVAKGMAILQSATTSLMVAWRSGLLPTVLILTGAFLALMHLLGRGDSVANTFNKIGDGFSKLFGLGGGDVLQPQIQKVSKGIEGMNNKIVDSSKFIDDVADKTKKAGKAAKNALAAFDEVYTIPEEAAATGLKLDEVAMPDLNLDGFQPPDFSPLTDMLTEAFKGDLGTSFKNAGIGALLGSLIGAAIGGLIGGPLGAKIGALLGGLAGAIAGWFWDDLSKNFQNLITGASIGALIGAAFGALLGQPLLGAAIGAAVGALAGYFWEDFKKAFETHPIATTVITSLGTIIGGVIGGLIGGPVGALIGGAIGTVVGGIAATFWDDFLLAWEAEPVRTGTVTALGAVLGGVIGALIGGPVGAVIGAAVGTLAGGIAAAFWDDLVAALDTAWQSTENWINGVFDAIYNSMSGWWDETNKEMLEWTGGIEKSVNDWAANTYNSFTGWFSDMGTGWTNYWKGVGEDFYDWVDTTKTDISTWAADTYKSFSTWVTDTGADWSTWWNETTSGFNTWVTDTESTINTWADETGRKFGTWVEEVKTGFAGWVTDVKTGFTTWKQDVGGTISEWCTTAKNGITGWVTDTTTVFTGWITDIKERFTGWAKDLEKTFTDLWDGIKDVWDNLFNKDKKVKLDVDVQGSGSANVKVGPNLGHANGGIFNREHIARFAEDNKAEAIIPLENQTAMQPFVDAVATGILNGLAPLMTQTRSGAVDDRRPLYVGTLIADERGMRELNRKLRIIDEHETQRTFGGDV